VPVSFSFSALSHLDVVCDNARSHAPFQDPYLALHTTSETSSCTSELEEAEDAASCGVAPQCISPARGLTRWGSQEDLISNVRPRLPSRSTAADSPILWPHETPDLILPPQLQLPPPPCPNIISRSPLDTKIHRIRSRWNSHIVGVDGNNLNGGNDHSTDGKATGKISLSQHTLPRRRMDCFEEIKLPHVSDTPGHLVDDVMDFLSCVPSSTQAQGSLWKEVSIQPTINTQRLQDISNRGHH
jgi:hypothetical protein